MKKSTTPAFRVLADLGRLVARGLPLDQLLGGLCESICELLGADGAVAVLVAPPLRVGAKLSRADAERLAARPGTPERIDRGGESIVVAPILSAGDRIGHVAALAHRPRAFSPEHEEVLAFLARSLVGDLEAARLYRLATIDPETHAGNRQLLAERLADEVRRSHRVGGKPLGVVRFDVEGWPRLTQAHGRSRAAEVLAEVVRRARTSLRTVDWIVRLGEEFFLCVLPAAGAEGAALAARRMADRVMATPIAIGPGVAVEPRIRCGVASLEKGMDEGGLLDAAERSLRVSN